MFHLPGLFRTSCQEEWTQTGSSCCLLYHKYRDPLSHVLKGWLTNLLSCKWGKNSRPLTIVELVASNLCLAPKMSPPDGDVRQPSVSMKQDSVFSLKVIWKTQTQCKKLFDNVKIITYLNYTSFLFFLNQKPASV